MTLRKTLAIIGVVLLVTALASAVVYADKPVGGVHDHGNGGGVDIEAFSNFFQPKDFQTNPKLVRWGLAQGKHNVTVCPLGSALGESKKGKPICVDGFGDEQTALLDEDFNKKRLVISFDFSGDAFAGVTIKYFCRFHGLQGMVGTVKLN